MSLPGMFQVFPAMIQSRQVQVVLPWQGQLLWTLALANMDARMHTGAHSCGTSSQPDKFNLKVSSRTKRQQDRASSMCPNTPPTFSETSSTHYYSKQTWFKIFRAAELALRFQGGRFNSYPTRPARRYITADALLFACTTGLNKPEIMLNSWTFTSPFTLLQSRVSSGGATSNRTNVPQTRALHCCRFMFHFGLEGVNAGTPKTCTCLIGYNLVQPNNQATSFTIAWRVLLKEVCFPKVRS